MSVFVSIFRRTLYEKDLMELTFFERIICFFEKQKTQICFVCR